MAGEMNAESKEADVSEELERQVAAPPQMRGLNMTYLTARKLSELWGSGVYRSIGSNRLRSHPAQELDQATGLSLPKAPPVTTDLDLTLLSSVLQSAEQVRSQNLS